MSPETRKHAAATPSEPPAADAAHPTGDVSPSELTPPASAGGGSGTPAWLPILTSLVCVGLMGVVLFLATRDGDEPQQPDHGASVIGNPPPGPLDLHGAPPRRGPAPSALAGCGELDPDNPPRIELDMQGEEMDLGVLEQGVSIVREVTFRSVGKGPLCVVSVKSSCGCLKASLDSAKRIYKPGEQGTVRLAVDTTGRMGVINKRVTITCNDPQTPLRSFRVKMDVNAGLLSDPRFLQFGRVPPRTSAARSLYLRTSKDETGWKVTGVRSIRRVAGMKPVEYTYEVEEVENPAYRRVKVRIIHPGMPHPGSFHDKIAVTTTHPKRGEVVVNAHIHVVPRIVFRARTISMGFVRPGVPRAPTTARIEAGTPGITFRITGVEVLPADGETFGPGGVPFRATHGHDAKGWFVEVAYDGKTRQPGLIKATLRVSTDDEVQPTLEIPVRATVRAVR